MRVLPHLFSALVSQGHNVAGTAGVSDEAEVNNPSTVSDDWRYTYVVSYYTSVSMVGTALVLPSNMLQLHKCLQVAG